MNEKKSNFFVFIIIALIVVIIILAGYLLNGRNTTKQLNSNGLEMKDSSSGEITNTSSQDEYIKNNIPQTNTDVLIGNWSCYIAQRNQADVELTDVFGDEKTGKLVFKEDGTFVDNIISSKGSRSGIFKYDGENIELIYENNQTVTMKWDLFEETLQYQYGDYVLLLRRDKGDEDDKFSDDVLKETLQNYLDLVGAKEGSPEAILSKLNLLDNSINNSEYTDDNYVKTNVKYIDYKNAMLKYVSEDWFNENFTNNYKEKGGILYYFNGGASGMEWEVQNVTLKGDYLSSRYIGEVYNVHFDESKELENIEFSVINVDGKYVIDYCDY